MKPIHLVFIALINIVWAFNAVAIKLTVEAVQPLTAVTLRYGIVLLCCLPWMRWNKGRMRLVAITAVIGGAVFMALGGLAFSHADNVAALSIAGQLGVPFSLILAVIFYHERIRWIRITGIVMAFGGVAVMVFDPGIFDERVGVLFNVGASFCWAVGTLLFRRLGDLHPLNVHGWLALISIPLLIAASLVFEPGALASIASTPPHIFGWMAYSAIGASIFGHAGISYLFRHYPVSTVSPLTLPSPVLAVIVGVIVFHLPVTIEMVAGGLLTLVGVTIITLRTPRATETEVLA
jgi:O-acetylserine/cysteine efflux transporter